MTVLLLAVTTGSAATVAEGRQLAAPYRGERLLGSLPAIPEETWARVEAGEIVTGTADTGAKFKRVWAVGVVDVAIGHFWAALNDDQSKPEFSSLTHVELLSGAPCASGRVVFQYLDVSLMGDRWWVVRQTANTALAERSGGKVREMSWASLDDGATHLNEAARGWAEKGSQVPFTEGAWFLVDLGDGRTLVEYVASSDPGGMVPAGVASSFAAGSLKTTFDGMKRLAVAPQNRCLPRP